jgi:hypothetical protein
MRASVAHSHPRVLQRLAHVIGEAYRHARLRNRSVLLWVAETDAHCRLPVADESVDLVQHLAGCSREELLQHEALVHEPQQH